MRSFQGKGVQGNRGGLGKQPLSLAKYPLDVGISFFYSKAEILRKKLKTRRKNFKTKSVCFRTE